MIKIKKKKCNIFKLIVLIFILVLATSIFLNYTKINKFFTPTKNILEKTSSNSEDLSSENLKNYNLELEDDSYAPNEEHLGKSEVHQFDNSDQTHPKQKLEETNDQIDSIIKESDMLPEQKIYTEPKTNEFLDESFISDLEKELFFNDIIDEQNLFIEDSTADINKEQIQVNEELSEKKETSSEHDDETLLENKTKNILSLVGLKNYYNLVILDKSISEEIKRNAIESQIELEKAYIPINKTICNNFGSQIRLFNNHIKETNIFEGSKYNEGIYEIILESERIKNFKINSIDDSFVLKLVKGSKNDIYLSGIISYEFGSTYRNKTINTGALLNPIYNSFNYIDSKKIYGEIALMYKLNNWINFFASANYSNSLYKIDESSAFLDVPYKLGPATSNKELSQVSDACMKKYEEINSSNQYSRDIICSKRNAEENEKLINLDLYTKEIIEPMSCADQSRYIEQMDATSILEEIEKEKRFYQPKNKIVDEVIEIIPDDSISNKYKAEYMKQCIINEVYKKAVAIEKNKSKTNIKNFLVTFGNTYKFPIYSTIGFTKIPFANSNISSGTITKSIHHNITNKNGVIGLIGINGNLYTSPVTVDSNYYSNLSLNCKFYSYIKANDKFFESLKKPNIAYYKYFNNYDVLNRFGGSFDINLSTNPFSFRLSVNHINNIGDSNILGKIYSSNKKYKAIYSSYIKDKNLIDSIEYNKLHPFSSTKFSAIFSGDDYFDINIYSTNIGFLERTIFPYLEDNYSTSKNYKYNAGMFTSETTPCHIGIAGIKYDIKARNIARKLISEEIINEFPNIVFTYFKEKTFNMENIGAPKSQTSGSLSFMGGESNNISVKLELMDTCSYNFNKEIKKDRFLTLKMKFSLIL